MKRRFSSLSWMGIGFGVAFALAFAVLGIKGVDKNSVVLALQITARWSFLLFWMAYAGGAVAELFGPAFQPLAAHGREFGLAYAAAMLTHLGLVVWLSIMTSRPPLSSEGLVVFGIGIVWTYLMAVLSFGDLWKVLGSRESRTLRLVGVNYILIAFALDFLPAGIHGIVHHDIRRLVMYAPFAATSVAAPLLVFAAAAHRHLGVRYERAGFGPSLNLN